MTSDRSAHLDHSLDPSLEPMAAIDVPISLSTDDKSRHWLYFQKERDPASRHKTDNGISSVQVQQKIHNGRGQEFLLDEASFELVDIPTALSTEDFYSMKDSSELRERYHAEVEAVVKKKLGCDKIMFMHHQVRNAMKAGTPGVAGYAGGGPHTDSSALSGDEQAMNMLTSGNDSTRYKRYLYLNLWRNIADEPIENDHLAVLDERSTAKPDDYIPRDLIGPGYKVVQYGLNARHAKHHKWYYFPNMQKSEGILFKQADSDFTLPGRTCFHMSVNDPSVPASAKPRESIELRMFCFWEEVALDAMPTAENMYMDLKQDPEKLALDDRGRSSEPGCEACFAMLRRMFRKRPESSRHNSSYSGKLEDYKSKIHQAIMMYPSWPQQGKSWAEEVIKADGQEKGIAKITWTIVDDQGDYQGFKNFRADQKRAILGVLLADDAYMSLAKKNFTTSG